MVWFFIILAIIIAILIVVCFFVSNKLFVYAIVRKDKDGQVTREELEKQGAGEFADEILKSRADFFNTQYREVEITSYDGLKLVGLLYEAPHPKGTIILFHGYRSSPVNDFSIAKDFYKGLGLNVLMPYQRAHGKSEGMYITFGIRERHDVHKWIEFINKTKYSQLPIFLSGLSMGCSTVLMSAGETFPKNVKLIIADCGFTSPYDIFEHIVKTTMKVPFKPVIPFFNFICRRKAGFGVNDYSTVDAVKNCKIPVFFIHGEADDFVPPEMSFKAYKACASEKYLLTVPEATHALSFMMDKDTYKPTLKRLISRYIAN